MNRDDIIDMALEAGIVVTGEAVWKLCELVAAAEREACARMVEAFHQHGYDFTGDLELHDAIRARGQI